MWVMGRGEIAGPITHTLCVNSIGENSKFVSIFAPKNESTLSFFVLSYYHGR